MARGNGTMERLRTDLLRRARRDTDGNQRQEDQQPATNGQNENPTEGQGEADEQSSPQTRTARRIHMPRLPRLERSSRQAERHREGPKSPDLASRPLTLVSSRYGEPGNPPSSLGSPVPLSNLSQPLPPAPAATRRASSQLPLQAAHAHQFQRGQEESPPHVVAENRASDDNRDEFIHPQERRERGNFYPEALDSSGQNEGDAGDEESGRGSSASAHPKRFLFCFPWIKSRRVRSQILTVFVSGMFLAILLAVYLGLALTNHIARGELTVMIILVILAATMFFCYSVIRLCILVTRGDRSRRNGRRFPEMMGLGGYVIPPKPIPVVLAQDEEAAGIESEASKSGPPAYGLWRESVRVDPNRLFWQRNTAAEAMPSRPETRNGPRPPSYASDDGITYVVEARPRSLAPPPNVPIQSSSEAAPRLPTIGAL